MLVLMIFVSFFVSLLMFLLGVFLSFEQKMDREKSSSFECGFEALEFFRNPFSVRFFLIAVQFLIFDIEVALAFPVVLSSFHFLQLGMMVNLMIFFVFLTLGFLHEWNEGSLDWK